MTKATTYIWEDLELFCKEVFIKAGVSDQRAEIVAKSLIEADLRGVDSHGVVRTAIYLERLEKSMIDANAEILVASNDESVLLLDGQNTFGAVVGTEALNLAMKKSQEKGVGLVGVKNSNHFGTGAFYVKQAIEKDLILMVLSNASQTMPPTGGVKPFLGTNPLAVGVPAGKQSPFVLDMATSVVARGKIIVEAEKGNSIPEGWAIDKNGQSTTNPQAALEGSVLPLGGAKGYGISMFIDILAGVLTGAGFGKYVNNMYENWEEPQNVGHIFLAIDIKKFMPLEHFKERMDQYISELKAEPKAVGVEEIFIPGEIEERRSEERKKSGIVLPVKVAQTLEEIGEKYGVNLSSAVMKMNFDQEEIG